MERPQIDVKRTVKLFIEPFPENFDYEDYESPGRSEIFYANERGCVLRFACPGCGKFGQIRVGWGEKPASPSWLLTGGDRNDPTTWTLAPSIFCTGCCQWHGHLENGVYKG